MTSRRDFLRAAGMAGAGTLLFRARAFPFDQSPLGVRKFSVSLPGLGPGGKNELGNYIPVLTPNTTLFPGVDFYQIVARQFKQQVHPAIRTTTFWGYAADGMTPDSRYLGGVIVAKRGTPVKLKVTNQLPGRHILPVDPTMVDPKMSAEVGGRTDRITVHLHGGLVRWDSDGGPFSWYTNPANGGFGHGSSFINGDGPGAAIYDYPNDQSARFIWYHDHAYGLTRTNAYAGIATAYLITDDAESQLISSGILPDVDGYPLGIPLVIQDKTFWDGEDGHDPGYGEVPPAGAKQGSLWYPHTYEGPPLAPQSLPPTCGMGTGRWDSQGGTPPPVSTVPEFFSDTILVNGAPYPKLPVARRRYRFRFLNGSQARFYNLQLYLGDGTADGITLKESPDVDNNGNTILIPQNQSGPRIIQIGNEAGFLPAPVVLNNPAMPIGFKSAANPLDPTNGNVNRYNLLVAPAERPDVIVDFRDVPAGSEVILYNDAPAPFPGGDIRNDYFGNDTDLTCIGGAPRTVPGYGPDTRILMKFVVGSATVSEMSFNDTLAALQGALPVAFKHTQPSTSLEADGPPRVKALDEDFDAYGRLRQLLGSPNVSEYLSVPTDVAERGEVQRWKIFNLTADTHPMHFHLVNVAVRKREAWKFDPVTGSAVLPLQAVPGTARPADPNEQGWKETVRMNPGEVVTVDMKFDLPAGKPAPPSPRLQASYGIKGAEYVWHCHILEHEEHDMMHALVVI